MNIRFLGLDEVLALHVDQIETYGGTEGVRDLGLLESAVAEASFGGDHAFINGNKRVAAAAMFMFLYLNDLELGCSEDELVELTLGVARGETTKAEVAVFVASRVSAP